MSGVAVRRRSREQIEALALKDFDRYRGKVILIHYAIDQRRFGPVQLSFHPPLLARIADKKTIEWNEDHGCCDVSYDIMPLDLQHDDLCGVEWLTVNGPGRSENPMMDEYWHNHWTLAKRAFGFFGPWVVLPRRESVIA